MTLDLWLLFVVTEAALCLSPGPAVLYVLSQGLSRGFTASFAGTLGIVSGNVILFAASALGLGTLIFATGELFVVVKWAGVLYLFWLGVRLLRGASLLATPAAVHLAPSHRIYRGGLIVQLANPKNLVFFIAIFPPFIDPDGNVPLQILVLGATSQLIEIVTLAAYGALASGAGRWLRESAVAVWVDRAAGSLLVGVGISLALMRPANA